MKKYLAILFLVVVINPSVSLASTLSCSDVDGMAIFGYDYGKWIHIGAIGNEYNSLSIANEYGAGSEYSSKSIFNEYGSFGSKYSSYSAFNDYASKPPIIVNNNYKLVGYLTTDDYKFPSINTYEAIACAKQSYISPNSSMKDVSFSAIPSSAGYSYGGGSSLPALTDEQMCVAQYGANSQSPAPGKCGCKVGYQWNIGKTLCIMTVVEITTTQLPNAYVNQPYSAYINYTSTGTTPLLFAFYETPNDIDLEHINSMGNNGTFYLKLTPRKAGNYSLKFKVLDGDLTVDYKVINLNVIDVPKDNSVVNALINAQNTPVNNEYKFTRTLKTTTKGEDVRFLQQGLIKLGYLNSAFKTSTTFDTQTRNAVKKFQSENKLKSDGVFGPSAQKIFMTKLK